ncbi:MAG: permease-like cell division protein FtsX [Muribaculaceae bacterium]|nr:permease-like cell division protein FtsX [Muribaculaceae bacterium]
MSNKRSKRISTFGSQLTSIVSVSLVLLLLGIVAMTGLAGRGLTDEVRRNIGFIVKMERDAPEAAVNKAKKVLGGAPYVEHYVYSSADDIMASESALLGEDIAELVEINPYSSEFDVKVRPAYANIDSIERIVYEVRTIPGVEEVITEADVIHGVDTTFRRISGVLLAVAGVLLFISFVLINNTVSLSIYSRRFVIHTMRLVGATGGFIRRPFVLSGCRNGLIAGLIASAILAGLRFWTGNAEPGLIEHALPWWPMMAYVLGGTILSGVLVCAAASLFATSRQLRRTYDELFLK